jgi:hypothetical protein
VWLNCDSHGGYGSTGPGRVTRAGGFAIRPGGDIIFPLENHSFLNIYDLVGRFFCEPGQPVKRPQGGIDER